MKIGNFAFELAELRAEQERETAIARAQAAVRAVGETRCVRCGDPIPDARRWAFPAAKRCLDCQSEVEARGRRK
jgi:phage/conjugal plasmid C-4 type zinc finger TraR family protein